MRGGLARQGWALRKSTGLLASFDPHVVPDWVEINGEVAVRLSSHGFVLYHLASLIWLWTKDKCIPLAFGLVGSR